MFLKNRIYHTSESWCKCLVDFVIIPYPPFIRKVSICFIKLVKLYQTWKPFLKIFIVGSWNWLQSSWRIFFERYFHFLPFEIHISTIAKNRCIYYVNISFYKDICLCVHCMFTFVFQEPPTGFSYSRENPTAFRLLIL